MSSTTNSGLDNSSEGDAASGSIQSWPSTSAFSPNGIDAYPAAHLYFRQAESYRSAAEALLTGNGNIDLLSLPISNLYSHAIEMYLKCFLSLHGVSVEELDGKYNRNFRRMRKRVDDCGLKLVGPNKATLEYFVRTPVSVRTKYSSTAYYYIPGAEDLGALCNRLREEVVVGGTGPAIAAQDVALG